MWAPLSRRQPDVAKLARHLNQSVTQADVARYKALFDAMDVEGR